MINPEDKLKQLMNDPNYLEAIRWAFNKNIELEMPRIDLRADNDLVGEQFRAYQKAKEILNKTFIEIESYKETRDNPKSFDKAI